MFKIPLGGIANYKDLFVNAYHKLIIRSKKHNHNLHSIFMCTVHINYVGIMRTKYKNL